MTPKLKLLIIIASTIVAALIITITTVLVVRAVDVQKVETLSFDGPNKQLLVGHSLTLTVSTSPDDAKNKKVSFSTSDRSVVSIVETTGNSVTLLANKRGKVVVTATSAGNKKIKDECIINVTDVLVEQIGFSKESFEFFVGETFQIPLVVTPANANVTSLAIESFDSSHFQSVQIKTKPNGDKYVEVVAKKADISQIAVSVNVQTEGGEANILTRTVIVKTNQSEVESFSVQLVSVARYFTDSWVSKSKHRNVLVMNSSYSVYLRAFAVFENVSGEKDVTGLVDFTFDDEKLVVTNADFLSDKKFKIQAKPELASGKTLLQVSFQGKTETLEVMYFDQNQFNKFLVSFDPVETLSEYQIMVGEIAYPRFVFMKNDEAVEEADSEFIFEHLYGFSVSRNNVNVGISTISQIQGVSTGSCVLTYELEYKYWDNTFRQMVVYESNVNVKVNPIEAGDFYFEINGVQTATTNFTAVGNSAVVRIVCTPIGSVGSVDIDFEDPDNLFTIAKNGMNFTITLKEMPSSTTTFELVFKMGELEKIFFVTVG